MREWRIPCRGNRTPIQPGGDALKLGGCQRVEVGACDEPQVVAVLNIRRIARRIRDQHPIRRTLRQSEKRRDLCDTDFRTPDTVLDLIGDQRPCAGAKGTIDALLIRWQIQCGADRERDLPHEPQVLHLPDVRAPQIRFDEDLQRIASLQWFGEACDPCFQFPKTGEPTEESVRKRVAT
jgi:hypothetical protein